MDDTSSDVIDYEALVGSYHRRLVTVLRAFRAEDAGRLFLDSWVPAEDHLESIDGIFEAAFGSGRSQLTVRVGQQTLAAISVDTLLSRARAQGAVESWQIDDALFIRIERHEESPARTLPGEGRAFLAPQSREGRRPAKAAPSAIPGPRETANPYKATLASVDADLHEGDAAVPNTAYIVVSHENAFLDVWIDGAAQIVLARHRGGSPETRALLEVICCLIEGLPLCEVAAHGGGRLELALRGRRGQRLVPGILSPENADPKVATGADILRLLIREYSTRFAPVHAQSNFVPPLFKRWATASNAVREWLTRDALAAIGRKLGLGNGAIELAHIHGDSRVVVSLSPDVPSAQRPSLLFDIERELKSSVEDSLSVYMEEMTDKNRSRRLAQIGEPRQ
jgi:hypothetical protein